MEAIFSINKLLGVLVSVILIFFQMRHLWRCDGQMLHFILHLPYSGSRMEQPLPRRTPLWRRRTRGKSLTGWVRRTFSNGKWPSAAIAWRKKELNHFLNTTRA